MAVTFLTVVPFVHLIVFITRTAGESFVAAATGAAGAALGAGSATTTLTQKDGWLRLSANGFHYSTPQIKIKLTQEKVAVAEPAPSATPVAPVAAATKLSPAVRVMKTIKCTKGTTVRKVTASKPTCPKGYKKA